MNNTLTSAPVTDTIGKRIPLSPSSKEYYFKKQNIITLFGIVGPPLAIVDIALVFHSFVLNAIEANRAINFGIILTASLGVVLIVMRLLDAQKDFYIIERFSYEVGQGADMNTLLQETWINQRYVRHYLNHIAHTGGTLSSQLEHSLIQSELKALREDYDSRLEFPQFIVGFMIAMGLLGTFIGLLTTLTGISEMLDGMGNSNLGMDEQFKGLIVKLREPIGGMGIAFSASMFGLITSLMLAIMMTNLRRYINRVISLAHNVMHDLILLAHDSKRSQDTGLRVQNIIPSISEPMPASVQATILPPSKKEPVQNREIDELGDVSYDGRDALLAGRLDILSKRVESLTSAFTSYSDSTRRMSDLLGVGPRMREIAEKSLEAMQSISSAQVDQQRMSQAVLEANYETIRKLEDILGAQRQFAAQTQRDAQTSMDVSSQVASLIASLAESQKQARTEFTFLLQSVINQMTNVKDVEIGVAKHLNEIKESLIKVTDTPQVMDMIASGISEQTVLFTSLIEETRRVQQGLLLINRSLTEKMG